MVGRDEESVVYPARNIINIDFRRIDFPHSLAERHKTTTKLIGVTI